MKALREMVRDLRARHLWEPAKSIAEKHHVNVADVLSRKRHAPIAAARHELWALAYEMIPSYPLLGEIFDRDHTSIFAGVRAHRDRVALATAIEADRSDQLTLWGYAAPRASSSSS